MKHHDITNPTYIIGYGTLLLQASLATSIGRAATVKKEFIPVSIDGYIRTFNIRPDHYSPSKKFDGGVEERAAMNIEPSANHSFNGLPFPITLEELKALDKREAYYERRVVPLRAFDTGELLGEGHSFVGLEQWIRRDPKILMPHWRDIVWGRTGAYSIGKQFGQYFDETTYLADGTTLMIDVYRELLKDISDVEFPK